MKSGRFIGVMSGTSLDGVDVVLATIDEHRVAQLASLSFTDPGVSETGCTGYLRGQQLTLSQFGQLDTQLGRLFADAVNALLKEQNLQARDIVAIGCHGQTVWHEPTGVAPHTLQIGDNNQIVARTGITVVGDFRRRDIAPRTRCTAGTCVPSCAAGSPNRATNGAQYWRHRQSVTAHSGQPVGGYDTGHGNMLMDARIWRQAGKPYDKDAEWARAGKVILPLLQNMLSDPYFSQPAPKSTGREYFNYGWLERHLRHFPGLIP